ncbi:MAG: GDSL-type esterase/lipase family protein [Holophagaceae bacterium]
MVLRRALTLFAAAVALRAGTVPDLPERVRQARAGAGLLRILHLGDSHVAAASGHRSYDAFFRARFGDGGPGSGLPWAAPRPGLRASASPGWRFHRKDDGDRMLGLGGSFMETARAGTWARVEGRGSRMRLQLLRQPGGGRAAVRLDGALLATLDLDGETGLVPLERELPASAGPHTLEVHCLDGGRVRLLGVAFEGAAGAVYSPMGVVGAQASWMLEVPESLFTAEVAAEAPDLVILAFGTNEANDPAFDPPSYQHGLEQLLGRFHRAAPQALLVLLGPPDARLPRAQPGALERVAALQQAVAARAGALLLDQRRAMGGPGAIAAWLQEGLAARDQVHFAPAGYQRLAVAVLGSLMPALGQSGDIRIPDAPRSAFRELPRAREAAPPSPPASGQRVDGGEGHAIYVFRQADGRLFITDNPASVAGKAGTWVGKAP